MFVPRAPRIAAGLGCLLASLAIWGCTQIIQADWDKPFATTGTGGAGGATTSSTTTSSTSSTSTGSGGAEDGGADAADDADAGPVCAVQTATYPVVADSQIIKGSCGSIVYGGAEHLSVNANIVIRPVMRFRLTSDMGGLLALEDGKASKVTLTLNRVLSGGDCGTKCPSAPGQVRVYPLRNGWVEGAGMPSDGATWCLRIQPSTTWEVSGADGPTDHGASAGVAAIVGTESQVKITLDPSTFATWLDVTKGEISFLLVPENGAIFVFDSKESKMGPPPSLEVEYCSPDAGP